MLISNYEDAKYLVIGVEDGWIKVNSAIWKEYCKMKKIVDKMEKIMFEIQKIDCSPGDAIILEIDIDEYGIEFGAEITKHFEKALPKNPIIVIPKDSINSVKIISSQQNFFSIDGSDISGVINVPLSTTGGNELW